MTTQRMSRRLFTKTLALGATAGVLGRRALADEPRKLDPKDPAATALGYVDDASQVEPAKFPRFTKGSNCGNCLKLEGQDGNTFRPCTLFPGKLVSVNGWCSGWTAEI